MSLHDYRIGLQVERKYTDDDFYGIVQGLMRMADTDNLNKLKAAFPNTWNEL